jgi:hypothetical protein
MRVPLFFSKLSGVIVNKSTERIGGDSGVK